MKLLPCILFEKYINILALQMASPGNRHRANCIGALRSLFAARFWRSVNMVRPYACTMHAVLKNVRQYSDTNKSSCTYILQPTLKSSDRCLHVENTATLLARFDASPIPQYRRACSQCLSDSAGLYIGCLQACFFEVSHNNS